MGARDRGTRARPGLLRVRVVAFPERDRDGSVIRVGVVGPYGRMGREVCRAVASDPECSLVAAVDVNGGGENIGPLIGHPPGELLISDELDALTGAEVAVAVDFPHPDAVMDDIRWCVRHAVHIVVGTTGLSSADLD